MFICLFDLIVYFYKYLFKNNRIYIVIILNHIYIEIDFRKRYIIFDLYLNIRYTYICRLFINI